MQLALLVCFGHMAWQQVGQRVVAGDDAGQQVALGRDHLGVLVGVFVQQCRVALFHQPGNVLRQPSARLACEVAVVAVFDIGPCHFRRLCHQQVFHPGLDFVDVDFFASGQFIPDGPRQRVSQSGIGMGAGPAGSIDSLGDAGGVKGGAAAVALDDYGFHEQPREGG